MASPEKELQDLLIQQTQGSFPALSVAIGKGKEMLWHASAGYADIKNSIKNTPETAFGIGSITKVFIAVIALQLNEEGLLPLDKPVSHWLDEKITARIPSADTATVRQLLSHYSAIPSWETQPSWIYDARGKNVDPEKVWLPHENLDYIRGEKALGLPGKQFSYSNTNFTLLGMLIECITQNSLEEALRRRIFEPLFLEHTFLETGLPASHRKVAARYHCLDSNFIENAALSPFVYPEPNGFLNVSATNLSVEWAAGGIISTAQDLLTFMLALKNGQLLTPSGMAAMQSWLPADKEMMGLSLFKIETEYGPALGHGGNVLGFSACVWWYAKTDCALAILTNLGSMHAAPQANCASQFFRQSTVGLLAQEICSRY